MKLITELTEEVQVEIITEEKTNVKCYFIEGPFLQSEIQNRNGRVYSMNILEPEVVRYMKEFVESNRAFGELGHPECYINNNFDVLTTTGWKAFSSLSVGDYIQTRNKNGEIEENPIERIINEPYIGHAYHIHGKNIDSKITPNHRLILENRYGEIEVVTIEEIYNNRKKYNKHKIVKTGNWKGNSPSSITIPAVKVKRPKKCKNNPEINLDINSNVFVQFLGIWLAEGHVSPAKYGVFITQRVGEKAEEIEKLLNKMPISYNKNLTDNNKTVKFIFNDARLHAYLKPLGNKYSKYIPQEIKNLDPVLLDELIQWYVKGDGRTKNNFQNLFSVSKKLIEDLHECLIKAGGSGNWTEIVTQKDYYYAGHLIKAKNKKPLYQLNLSTVSGIYLDDRFLEINKIEHSGNVYCLTVKNNNFYVKDNNKAYWTGNSPNINLERVSHMIKSLKKEGNNFTGKAKILDTPYGKIVKNLIDEGAKLGVSSRGLGSLEERNGVAYVKDDFRLSTAADIVADPSAPEAFVRGIMEDREWVYESGILKAKEIEIAKKEIKKTNSRKLEEVKLQVFNRFLRGL